MTRVSLSTSLLAVLCVVALSGCASNAIFPDPGSPLPESVPLGSFQGSVYGGHAPIVNSRIFVLQAGTSGYGGKATSLLNNISGVTTQDTSGDATNGMSFVTTNAQGDFNVTGDYSCTPGLPVYLYGAGGTSSPTAGNGLTGYTVSGTTITFTSFNLVSVGQYVQFTGLPAALNGLNSGTYKVQSATPENVITNTAGSFSITVSGYTNGSAILAPNNSIAYVILDPPPGSTNPNGNYGNPAIVTLAVLGNCPSSGAANFSSLTFVYMNEVSTVAAAYALGGFFTNTSGSLVATDAVHLSIPVEGSFAGIATGNSPSWVAIENAALTANDLYNIQGTGTISLTGDGEGHIANIATPNGGTVSQGLINAIANALAACVDSGNSAINGPTAPCTTLLNDALSQTTVGGIPTGQAPTDIATVAINLAHNPWNNKAQTIINLATGTAPYSPYAATVNDLAVTITYPITVPSQIDGGVAVDSAGNVWVTSHGLAGGADSTHAVEKLSTTGAVLFQASGQPGPPGMVALDSQDNAWIAFRDSTVSVGGSGTGNAAGAYEYSKTGTLLCPTAGYASGTYTVNSLNSVQFLTDDPWVAVDANDNAYFAQHPFNAITELDKNGNFVQAYQEGGTMGNTPSNGAGWNGPIAAALDASGDVYGSMTPGTGTAHGLDYFTAGSPNGQATLNTGIPDAFGLALDASGNTWATDLASTSIFKWSSNRSTLTTYTSTATLGGVSAAVGIVADPAGMIYVSSTAGGSTDAGSIGVFGGTSVDGAVYLTGKNGITGTTSSSTPMKAPYFMALDGSGNLWVNTDTTLVKFMGFATPVLTPISANLKKGVIMEMP